MSDGELTPRGVYVVDPPGPNGEVLLIVVDSTGRRCRAPVEVMPEERELAIEQLWRFLDARDPVNSRGWRELHLVRTG